MKENIFEITIKTVGKDINGNSIQNVLILETLTGIYENSNITQEFFQEFKEKFMFRKLKNGTVNITEYKSVLEKQIKKLILKYCSEEKTEITFK